MLGVISVEVRARRSRERVTRYSVDAARYQRASFFFLVTSDNYPRGPFRDRKSRCEICVSSRGFPTYVLLEQESIQVVV